MEDLLGTLIAPTAIAMATSWATAKLTARNETLRTYGEKRSGAYDELLNVLDDFRVSPSIVLKDSYLIRLMKLSNKIRVYGSREVLNAVTCFVDAASRRHNGYWRDIEAVEEASGNQGDIPADMLGLFDEYSQANYNENFVEFLYEKAEKEWVPSRKQALELTAPILEAMKESELGGIQGIYGRARRRICQCKEKLGLSFPALRRQQRR